MKASTPISLKRLGEHQVIPIATRLAAELEPISPKYDFKGIEFVMNEYYYLFNFIKQRGYKRVLDFGCGIGMGKIVHDLYDFPFELESCDLNVSWNENEKEAFDKSCDLFGIDILRVTDVTSEDFKFLDQPSMKYDCVITFRFPPLSKLLVSIEDFKKRLSPYTEEDFTLLYFNVTPLLKDKHEMYIWRDEKTDPKFIHYDNRIGWMEL